MHEKPSEAVGA